MNKALRLSMLAGSVLALFTACQTPSSAGTFNEQEIALKPVPSVSEPYSGASVVVTAFPSKSLAHLPWYGILGPQSIEYLSEFLIEAGFQPLEGFDGDLKKVIQEIDYGRSGMVDPKTAVEVGKHLGSRYIVTGAVTDYRVVEGKGRKGASVMGFGIGGGGAYVEYFVQASARVVDIETRRVLATKTATFSHRFDVGGGGIRTPWGSFGQSEEIKVSRNTAGTVLQLCLNKLAIDLVGQLNARA